MKNYVMEVNVAMPWVVKSKYGLITGAGALYSAAKVRKLGKDLDNYKVSIQNGQMLMPMLLSQLPNYKSQLYQNIPIRSNTRSHF